MEQSCPVNENPSAKLYVVKKVYFLKIIREKKGRREGGREDRKKEKEVEKEI